MEEERWGLGVVDLGNVIEHLSEVKGCVDDGTRHVTGFMCWRRSNKGKVFICWKGSHEEKISLRWRENNKDKNDIGHTELIHNPPDPCKSTSS